MLIPLLTVDLLPDSLLSPLLFELIRQKTCNRETTPSAPKKPIKTPSDSEDSNISIQELYDLNNNRNINPFNIRLALCKGP